MVRTSGQPENQPLVRRISGNVTTSRGSGVVKRVMPIATGPRPVMNDARDGRHWGEVT